MMMGGMEARHWALLLAALAGVCAAAGGQRCDGVDCYYEAPRDVSDERRVVLASPPAHLENGTWFSDYYLLDMPDEPMAITSFLWELVDTRTNEPIEFQLDGTRVEWSGVTAIRGRASSVREAMAGGVQVPGMRHLYNRQVDVPLGGALVYDPEEGLSWHLIYGVHPAADQLVSARLTLYFHALTFADLRVVVDAVGELSPLHPYGTVPIERRYFIARMPDLLVSTIGVSYYLHAGVVGAALFSSSSTELVHGVGTQELLAGDTVAGIRVLPTAFFGRPYDWERLEFLYFGVLLNGTIDHEVSPTPMVALLWNTYMDQSFYLKTQYRLSGGGGDCDKGLYMSHTCGRWMSSAVGSYARYPAPPMFEACRSIDRRSCFRRIDDL